MLTILQVVQGKGSAMTAGSANMHINGALALFRTVLPNANAPGGVRPVLQLIYAMVCVVVPGLCPFHHLLTESP